MTYAALTKDEAQRSIRIFYGVVKLAFIWKSCIDSGRNQNMPKAVSMKKVIVVFASLIAIVLLAFMFGNTLDLNLTKETDIKVCFSPKGGCTEAIIREINQSKTEILVQAYSFTSAPIAKALLEARKRGVDVQAILDKSQRSEKYTAATFLKNAGLPTYIDDKHAIAHNKIMIIDRKTVITGSFNFTKAAEEKNAENLLIIHHSNLAGIYIENWNSHKAHSENY